MYKYVAANDAMKKSIGFFEHEGIFSLHLQKLLTKNIMKSLLSALGCKYEGQIEQYSKDGFSFTSYLHSQMHVTEKCSPCCYPNYEKIIYSRNAIVLKNAAIQCGFNDIVVACNKWMGLDENDGIAQVGVAQETGQKKIDRKYETVDDILNDEDNFGLIVMNLYIQLEKLWTKSVEKFIESNINIQIDQNVISQKTMKGKFYLNSIKNVKLTDFLSNLDSIECSLVKDIDQKLNQLNANVVHDKKVSFSGKNEVASWCSDNGYSHVYDKLIELGFDSLSTLSKLDDTSCQEMGLKGRFRIDLLEKVKLIKN